MCCPDKIVTEAEVPQVESRFAGNSLDLLPKPGVCGGGSTPRRIFNGQKTEIYEFPWMALLEYAKRTIKTFQINCLSLIYFFISSQWNYRFSLWWITYT